MKGGEAVACRVKIVLAQKAENLLKNPEVKCNCQIWVFWEENRYFASKVEMIWDSII